MLFLLTSLRPPTHSAATETIVVEEKMNRRRVA
ncbi:hypothetical protein A2U01_0067378, partial [Trifolium medium]|nr:hypothetical protein [Trifolium medium]